MPVDKNYLKLSRGAPKGAQTKTAGPALAPEALAGGKTPCAKRYSKHTRLPADIPSPPLPFFQLHVPSVYRFHKNIQELFGPFHKKNVFHGDCFGKVSETYAIFYKIFRVKLFFLGIMITLFTKKSRFFCHFQKLFLRNVYRFHSCRFTIFFCNAKNISSSPWRCATMNTQGPPGGCRAGGMRYDAEKVNITDIAKAAGVQNHHFAI